MEVELPPYENGVAYPPGVLPQHMPGPSQMKRSFTILDEAKYEDPSFLDLPSNDTDTWYYPSHGFERDEVDLRHGMLKGNWGQKMHSQAKWIRKGKMVAWAPWYEDWEAEESARNRIRQLLPTQDEDPAPLTLPHLRSPSPPLTAPYQTPRTQHFSYSSFVMDKATTQSFRSGIFDELEHSTNTLIEGETNLQRALGRLWQVMSEDPDEHGSVVVPKREDMEEADDDVQGRRFARAPNLSPAVHKLFLSSSANGEFDTNQHSHSSHSEMQLQTLEKSLATLRELQDDGREYVERLEEIREGLGDARAQRNGIWDLVRKRAIEELHTAASSATVT